MHAKFHPQAVSPPLAHPLRKSGFTLIELLAVITIMAILLSIGAVGIKNVGKAQGTTAGAAVAEGLMEEARTIAVSRGTEARLIINAVPNTDLSSQKFLREMYVVYLSVREVDAGGNVTKEEWTRSSRATMMPDKVYFDKDASKVTFASNAGAGSQTTLGPQMHTFASGKIPSMNAYYYAFNSEGICQSPGASFVCIEGVMVNSELKGDKENQAGFVIWRNGRTSIIRDTSTM